MNAIVGRRIVAGNIRARISCSTRSGDPAQLQKQNFVLWIPLVSTRMNKISLSAEGQQAPWWPRWVAYPWDRREEIS